MKYIWEEKDIDEAGLYVISLNGIIGSSAQAQQFARSHVYKINYGYFEKQQGKYKNHQWSSSTLFNGSSNSILRIGSDKSKVVDWLNTNCFRPLKKSELITLIESTDQGFYER